jgi:S-formylglutathione hydrolase
VKIINYLFGDMQASIMGHSMGGHGALTIALKTPSMYKSVSAFAPICNPSQVPWGKKAFSGYLGESNTEAWKEYDATELVSSYSGPKLDVLIDTGTEDEFLQGQLHPWAFVEAAAGKLNLTSNMREGYDHSYFFISTFVPSHIEFHAKYLL